MSDNPLNIDLDAMTNSNWDTGPYNQWAFRNMDQILSVACVSKGGGPVQIFPENITDIGGIKFELKGGGKISVSDHLKASFTDGFLVLHKGNLISESYFNGMRENSLHISQSVCKSIVGILAGILIDQGKIDPNKQVVDYVPDLKEGGYAGCTVRNLLDMRTGVLYEEDYDNPSREYLLLEQCSGWSDRGVLDAPDTYKEFLKIIKPNAPHGGAFLYRSIDTDILGWVCEMAGGASLAHLFSTEIWQKLGCDFDANLTIDKEGTALACGGFNASLRDYARLGQMVLNKGQFNGQMVVSENWISASSTGDKAVFSAEYSELAAEYSNGAYSNQWWVMDADEKVHSAIGIHGQFVYVDHSRDVVIVKLSSWPTAAHGDLELDDLRMMAKIASVLVD